MTQDGLPTIRTFFREPTTLPERTFVSGNSTRSADLANSAPSFSVINSLYIFFVTHLTRDLRKARTGTGIRSTPAVPELHSADGYGNGRSAHLTKNFNFFSKANPTISTPGIDRVRAPPNRASARLTWKVDKFPDRFGPQTHDDILSGFGSFGSGTETNIGPLNDKSSNFNP